MYLAPVCAGVGKHGWVPGSGAGISSTLRMNSDPRKALIFPPSPSAFKTSHSGHHPHSIQQFFLSLLLPVTPHSPPPTHSLSQHQLFVLHLRALLPTSSPFLLLPASPLYSADSFPISSTKSSNTILSHPSYCLRFTPPL